MSSALQMELFATRIELPFVPEGDAARGSSYVDPFLSHHREKLDAAGDKPLAFDYDTWEWNKNSAVGLDVEVYRNFFVVCFKRFIDGKRLAFERSERTDFNSKEVEQILRNNTIITFNGNAYDLYILSLAIKGANNIDLKEASDNIIFKEIRGWENRDRIIQTIGSIDHIDLIEPNPSVRMGLKMLAGRLHTRFLVDLPYDPSACLTPREMNVTTLYCHNDIDATEEVYRVMREPLLLRATLGKRYRVDLRSKSDSQVGETIVNLRVRQMTRQQLAKPQPKDTTFTYRRPAFLHFEDDTLATLLNELDATVFYTNSYGKTSTPPLLQNRFVTLGKMRYAMGIGGLHSTEAHRALRSDDNNVLIDVDVASQYPSIICNLGLYPAALGPKFLDVYKEIRAERLAAKAANDKVAADGGRVALNGCYGKLGSPYSMLYAPHLLVTVTLTGQLSILMLIERAERAGIPVVSANTDGVVFLCPRDRESVLNEILEQWEKDTEFAVERTRYSALYSSSVNTYIAIREDGKVKRKGPLADPWEGDDYRSQMSKNPQMTICSKSVVSYLRDNIPLMDTIQECKDSRCFITLIRANNGAYWRKRYFGKAIRYYWSIKGEAIVNRKGGRIPKTEGAYPMVEITDKIPRDIDLLRYFEEANNILIDVGVRV